MDLSGTIVPMATPVEPGGRGVDAEALAEFTRSLVDAGVHGLFPGSSIGEFPSLTDDQHQKLVRTVVSAVDGDATVIAGCCGTSVDAVRSRLARAADLGADAGVVVTPYYLSTTQSGLVRFFERVAADATLPILIYNIPALTGHSLAVETVVDLAGTDGIVGLKDTSGDLTSQHRVVTSTPPSFSVFQGATDIANASLNLGADGIIAGPANVFPAAMASLYEAHARGDEAAVNRLTREVVMPVVSAYGDIPTAAAIKYLVELDGLDIGDPLPPLVPVTTTQRRRLEACYEDVTETLDPATPDD